ncbi:potassium channel family protein [Kocuria dechangensis]|nr:potassium channel family protein [Kocuria dechangensis]
MERHGPGRRARGGTDWDRVSGRARTAAAVLFLGAWAWPVLDPGLAPAVVLACRAVLVAVWVLFVVDYLARLVRARDRRAFVAGHLVDLVALAFPVFRQLELVRLAALVVVVNRRAAADLRGRVAVYLVGGAGLLGAVGSVAVLDAERGAPGANIGTLGDAAWWAVSTMSTVGYGDLYPVTPPGRVVGGVLMLGGVAVFGLVTALLASWLVEAVTARRTTVTGERPVGAAVAGTDAPGPSPQGNPEPGSPVDPAEVAALRLRVAELTERLRRLDDGPDADAGPQEGPPGPGGGGGPATGSR